MLSRVCSRMAARPLAGALRPQALRRGMAGNTGAKPSENGMSEWLADKSTWPIAVIISLAVVGCGGFIMYEFSDPTVKIMPSNRREYWWNQQPNITMPKETASDGHE